MDANLIGSHNRCTPLLKKTFEIQQISWSKVNGTVLQLLHLCSQSCAAKSRHWEFSPLKEGADKSIYNQGPTMNI